MSTTSVTLLVVASLMLPPIKAANGNFKEIDVNNDFFMEQAWQVVIDIDNEDDNKNLDRMVPIEILKAWSTPPDERVVKYCLKVQYGESVCKKEGDIEDDPNIKFCWLKPCGKRAVYRLHWIKTSPDNYVGLEARKIDNKSDCETL
ncbi:hypothetical protein KIN20_002499 [Parelaphostrongylus tenuis]|uniref:Secreted protein n=1 Tax=Parelaphostrongylus tenuis TaxID=148309 RepID=A0AAD5MGW8_PARTN|nr:hypothetical protein KIN20_002499 [Parelaphostrongylus tenuis]